ncbi:MAG TPA: hypothetical protein VHY22_00130 [Chthoniobacteraceae bacterium]|jgi:hypothetical protein|nr:hypothetical protein [Chthoniobacteraceae bacterium]
MSTRTFHGIRIAIVALATLVTTVPLLHAQDLSAEQDYLNTILAPSNKTILTAKASVLASTVAGAITSNTNGYTAAELAAAAFTIFDSKVRADRNTSAPLVVAASVTALFSGTDGTFNSDVASLVDAVVDVNQTTPKDVLSVGGQTAVVKIALGTISDQAVATGSTSLLTADASIGAALENDSYLGTLGRGGKSLIIENAIAGINGAKGKSAADAPLAAQDYIGGIVGTDTLPGVPALSLSSTAYNNFAIEILKPVSKNTSVDEAGAYAVALVDGSSSQSNLVTLATALYGKYVAAQAKITQGIAATISITGTNDATRAALIGDITTAAVKDAVNIDQGATFVDPYHADNFTTSVFSAVLAAPGGTKLIGGDATKIATAVGKTLGSDGDELTDVAVTFQNLIEAGSLPASSAAAYATDLINGAFAGLPKGSIYAYSGIALGDGGLLNVTGKTGITGDALLPGTAADLASIVDSLAIGVLSSGDTEAKIASYIGALVKGVANLTKNGTFAYEGNPNDQVNVAAYLAGSLATTVTGTVTGSADQAAIDAAIDSSLKGVVNKTVYGNASTAGTVVYEVAAPTYEPVGAISFAETAVTNL